MSDSDRKKSDAIPDVVTATNPYDSSHKITARVKASSEVFRKQREFGAGPAPRERERRIRFEIVEDSDQQPSPERGYNPYDVSDDQ